MMVNNQIDYEKIVRRILESPKYRNSSFLEETIRDLVESEAIHLRNEGQLERSVRQKLHNVVAFYLGEPDYQIAERLLLSAVEEENINTLKLACIGIMEHHTSTRERIPILDKIYKSIFSITGKPSSLLDLACGLHPLSIPWMNLGDNVNYYAYDINLERVRFLNLYFSSVGMKPLASHQDILASFPKEKGEIAFIFKEIHRFEQRKKGISVKLIESLNVPNVVVSFPTKSISKQHNLSAGYKRLFYKLVSSKPWIINELLFDNEIFFVITKF
jgi:16S rRNA (guanine(1405)-N(7))-methyltransferase